MIQVIEAARGDALSAAGGLLQPAVVGNDGELPRGGVAPDQRLDDIVGLLAQCEEDADALVVLFGLDAGRGLGGVEDDGDIGRMVAVQGHHAVEEDQPGAFQAVRPDATEEHAHGVQQVVAVDDVTHFGRPRRKRGEATSLL